MDQEERNALQRAAKTIAEHADEARFERWARVAELLIATGAARPNDYDSNSALGQLVSELHAMRAVLGSPLQGVEPNPVAAPSVPQGDGLAHLGGEPLADIVPRLRAELHETRVALEQESLKREGSRFRESELRAELEKTRALVDAQAAERTETLAHELRLARDKIADLERALRRARAGVFDQPTDADIANFAQRLRERYYRGDGDALSWSHCSDNTRERWCGVARVALG